MTTTLRVYAHLLPSRKNKIKNPFKKRYTSKNNTLTKNKKNDILLVENKEDFILWENIIRITKDTNIVENIRYEG